MSWGAAVTHPADFWMNFSPPPNNVPRRGAEQLRWSQLLTATSRLSLWVAPTHTPTSGLLMVSEEAELAPGRPHLPPFSQGPAWLSFLVPSPRPQLGAPVSLDVLMWGVDSGGPLATLSPLPHLVGHRAHPPPASLPVPSAQAGPVSSGPSAPAPFLLVIKIAHAQDAFKK